MCKACSLVHLIIFTTNNLICCGSVLKQNTIGLILTFQKINRHILYPISLSKPAEHLEKIKPFCPYSCVGR